ncbi:MAG: agmatine deiminase family protein [Bacteroidales bacterium]|jgi:agmatine deiminase
MKKLFINLLLVFSSFMLFGQPIYNEFGIELKHTMTAEEAELYKIYDVRTAPTDPPTGQIRPIGEFEPSEAVLIAYPYQFGIPISLIKEMAKDIKVIIAVPNTGSQNNVTNQLSNSGVNMNNVEFMIAPTDSYWTRDYGPWFMAIDDDHIAMYDFTYNRPRPNDNNVNLKVAQYLGIDRYASSIQGCGGNYMADSKDLAASTDLILEENTNYTEAQIRQHFNDYLGVENYMITEDPLADYIKHIDCWGKFLAPNKVIIGQVPESDPRYQSFEDVANLFANTTSAWGMPFEVYRVYTPGAQGYYGQATPYSNSLILNNKVFVALTGSSHDAAAIESYQQAMPGYEIIGIYYNGWLDTDALHCRTHEIIDREMLYIKHQPYFGEVQSEDGSVEFTTELYSYGNHTIYSDSVFVYVKQGNGNFNAYNLTNSANNTWTATVTGLQPGEIEYYIYAADNSGRRECHPYIGAPDPHNFILVTSSTYPQIEFDASGLSFTVDTEDSYSITRNIENVGTANLEFNITDITENSWFSISPISGVVEPNQETPIELSFNNLNNLENGTYNLEFNINSNDANNDVINVNFTVTVDHGVNTYPQIEFDASGLSFAVDTEDSYSITRNIENVGTANLEFNITNITENSWFSISPISGVVEPNQETPIELSFNDLNSLENGTYDLEFNINSNDADNNVIHVSFTVTVGYIASISIDPSEIDFSLQNGGEVSETITITNNGLADLNINIDNITVNNPNYQWLSVEPMQLTIPKQSSDEIKVVCMVPSDANSFEDTGSFVISSNASNNPELNVIVNVNNTSTFIEDISKSEIIVYPNPFNDELNIQGILNANRVLVQIQDLTGKIISSEYVNITGNNLNYNVNTSSMVSGIYFYKITGEQDVIIGKIIKK